MAIEVCGGGRVSGELKIQGSKNAVLPIMAASVLCEGTTVIENCPDILDVHAMGDVMRGIGGAVQYEGHTLTLDASQIESSEIQEKKAGDIRASILFLGSLLARFRRVKIQYPGGCSIGSRPVDFHLQSFRQMGAVIQELEDRISCEAPDGLFGADLSLCFPSVGATENIILAAVLAKGTTTIRTAAREPEIVELCDFLNAMGAKIQGAGSEVIRIDGVSKLKPVHWQLCSDRIVLLTWAMLTAGCGGEAVLVSTAPFSQAERQILEKTGCQIRQEGQKSYVLQTRMPGPVPFVRTSPYPGYPTDGQSLLMPVLCRGNGISTIEEGIFENRFRMVRQLRKLGANIDYVSNRARITGVTKLHSAVVEADDLRSGAGLLIATAMAEGTSTVSKEYYIQRGYEDVCGQMSCLGIPVRVQNKEERDLSE